MTTYKKIEYANTPVLVARAEVAGNAETAVSATTAGACTGNAATATALANARNFSVSDADASHTGTAVAFDGTAAATLPLPSTIKATLVGNADTATKINTNAAIGGATTPVYVAADGTVTAGTAIGTAGY